MKKYLAFFTSNSVARSSAIVFIASMVVNVGAYLYHLIVGRVMGPEKYGEFAALFSLLFILSVPASVIQLIITKSFSEFKARDALGESKYYYLVVMKLLVICSVISGVIFLFLIPLLQRLLNISSLSSFVWLYGIVTTTFLITAGIGVLNGYQHFGHSSIYQIIMIATRLFSGIILAPFGASAALFGIIVGNIITLVYSFIPLKFLYKAKAVKVSLPKKETIQFAIPTLLTTLGITLLYNFDVVLVKVFFDPEQAGIYASLNVFGKMIFFASSAIVLVLFPTVIEKRNKHIDVSRLLITGFTGVAGISFAIAVSYVLFAPILPSLLFGSSFSQASAYLGIYGFFMAFVTIINYVSTMYLAINKTKIWIFLFVGVVCEILVMTLFHDSLQQVIMNNMIISGILLLSTLLYYRHESKHT